MGQGSSYQSHHATNLGRRLIVNVLEVNIPARHIAEDVLVRKAAKTVPCLAFQWKNYVFVHARNRERNLA